MVEQVSIIVVPWWAQAMFSVYLTASIAFFGWLACKVISLGHKSAELEARMLLREGECLARVDWLRRIEDKLDKVSGDTATIKGSLHPSGAAAKNNEQGEQT